MQQAEHDLQQAQARLHNCNRWPANHAKHQQRLDELEEHYQVIGTLAELATGRNPLRLTCCSVLYSACCWMMCWQPVRVLPDEQGPLQLRRRKDTRNKGNRAGGLDLLVSDAYTGKERGEGGHSVRRRKLHGGAVTGAGVCRM
ncbi:MAG: hypothetical protein R3E95_10940 [Thiolinea sp.]